MVYLLYILIIKIYTINSIKSIKQIIVIIKNKFFFKCVFIKKYFTILLDHNFNTLFILINCYLRVLKINITCTK